MKQSEINSKALDLVQAVNEKHKKYSESEGTTDQANKLVRLIGVLDEIASLPDTHLSLSAKKILRESLDRQIHFAHRAELFGDPDTERVEKIRENSLKEHSSNAKNLQEKTDKLTDFLQSLPKIQRAKACLQVWERAEWYALGILRQALRSSVLKTGPGGDPAVLAVRTGFGVLSNSLLRHCVTFRDVESLRADSAFRVESDGPWALGESRERNGKLHGWACQIEEPRGKNRTWRAYRCRMREAIEVRKL